MHRREFLAGNLAVASLARPGGNVTGLTLLTPELSGKRLELLVDVLTGNVPRVALLTNPTISATPCSWKRRAWPPSERRRSCTRWRRGPSTTWSAPSTRPSPAGPEP